MHQEAKYFFKNLQNNNKKPNQKTNM